ncbi:hypothetical protein Bca52824_063026 [Brassica carinata]|uniref:LOB domain-containing protein n=1 Tax=Brassica carinata TaxID=52824 RepID=A0A8X7U8S5_BRACI|nr:hypothetical protein Bca52824_063026 [Brassica carinata]
MNVVLSENYRSDAVNSIVYEANARVQDPVYGCVGIISSLQRQLETLQTQLAFAQAELVHMKTLHRIDTKPPPYMASGISFPANKDLSNDVDMAFAYENGAGESLWSC